MEKETYLYKSPNHYVNLNNMRLSDKLCDVTVKVNDRKLRAHKVVLAANLKYFESMFLNSFQESKQDVVTMKGVEETHLEAFVSYAYTGEILLTDSNALNLLEVANYLSEDGIKEACIKFLQKHLKSDAACHAYILSNSIECSSLKNSAKQIILSNLGDCSSTAEFLDLDFESLRDILSNAEKDFVDSQCVCFEGVIRWIVHDVKSRRNYIQDLLSMTDMTKLTVDYLLDYFLNSIDNENYDIVIYKDVMSFYRNKCKQAKPEVENFKQYLIIVGGIDKKLHYQLYDFSEKMWSEPREIMLSTSTEGYAWNCGAILDNKFYYTINFRNSRGHFQTDLHAFDPVTRESKMLASESRLFRYLYFCGGEKSRKQTNQVLRYDPQTKTFEVLPSMRNKKTNATAIFHQGCLYVLGGSLCDLYSFEMSDMVEKYDFKKKEWTESRSMHETVDKCSAGILNGKLYACGGWGGCQYNSVEAYNASKNSWQLVAKMKKGRRNFSVVAHQGKLLAIGGNHNKTVEVYDPMKDQWQIDKELSSGLKISFGTSGLFSIKNE